MLGHQQAWGTGVQGLGLLTFQSSISLQAKFSILQKYLLNFFNHIHFGRCYRSWAAMMRDIQMLTCDFRILKNQENIEIGEISLATPIPVQIIRHDTYQLFQGIE